MKNHVRSLFSRVPGAVYLALSQILFARVANAQGLPGFNTTTIDTLVLSTMCSIAIYMFWIVLALTVVFVLVAAYKYLKSGGEPEKVSSATKNITWAAVSIVIALIARVFPSVILSIFSSSTTWSAQPSGFGACSTFFY